MPYRHAMEISIGTPVHGWIPFSILLGGHHLDFRASNVVNDPITDLVYAAIWSLDTEYEFPTIIGRASSLSTSTTRCVHFWLEPNWHSLTIELTDNVGQIDLWFAVGHTGGLFVNEHDISQTHQTLTGTLSAYAFAVEVHRAISDTINHQAEPLEKHRRHPFPHSTFGRLGEWLEHIADAENAGEHRNAN